LCHHFSPLVRTQGRGLSLPGQQRLFGGNFEPPGFLRRAFYKEEFKDRSKIVNSKFVDKSVKRKDKELKKEKESDE